MMLKNLFTLHIATAAGIRHRFHGRLAEWHLAVVMICGGLIYLLNGDIFSREAYSIVRQVAGQPIWGSFMLIIGSSRLVVLIINGAMPRGSPHLRSILSSVSALIWAVLLAGFVAYGSPLLIDVFLLMAVLVDLFSAYRAAQDARLEDDDLSGAGNDIAG